MKYDLASEKHFRVMPVYYAVQDGSNFGDHYMIGGLKINASQQHHSVVLFNSRNFAK